MSCPTLDFRARHTGTSQSPTSTVMVTQNLVGVQAAKLTVRLWRSSGNPVGRRFLHIPTSVKGEQSPWGTYSGPG